MLALRIRPRQAKPEPTARQLSRTGPILEEGTLMERFYTY